MWSLCVVGHWVKNGQFIEIRNEGEVRQNILSLFFSSADDVSSAELMVLLIVRRPSSVRQLLL